MDLCIGCGLAEQQLSSSCAADVQWLCSQPLPFAVIEYNASDKQLAHPAVFPNTCPARLYMMKTVIECFSGALTSIQ